MKPASVRAEIRRNRVDECRDVVVGDALALGDLRRARNARALPNAPRARRGNGSDLRPGVEDCELHSEPLLELGLLGPDPGHGRSGVAGDHCDDSSRRAHDGTLRTSRQRTRRTLVARSPIHSKAGGGEGWPQGRSSGSGPAHGELDPAAGAAAAAMSSAKPRPGEGDQLGRVVRNGARLAERRTEARDREDPAAVRHQPLTLQRGAGMEHERAGSLRVRDAVDGPAAIDPPPDTAPPRGRR